MSVDLSFHFDSYGEAADFLATVNGEDWPTATPKLDRTVAERPPWEDDGAETVSNTSAADPWAEDAKPASKPAKPASKPVGAGTLFPASGEYVKDSPGGERTWEFGLSEAPECDCGYDAAKVTGKKGKREWSAWWCPVGFGKQWKDKCKFSEFV